MVQLPVSRLSLVPTWPESTYNSDLDTPVLLHSPVLTVIVQYSSVFLQIPITEFRFILVNDPELGFMQVNKN